MTPTTVRLALAAAIVAGAWAISALAADSGRDPGATGVLRGPDGALKARGTVERLYPGALQRLRVRVRNRSEHAHLLRVLNIRVGDASPECSSDQLPIRRKRYRHIWIPPDARRVLKVNVRMRRSAPDACQGARWPLRFKLRGRRR